MRGDRSEAGRRVDLLNIGLMVGSCGLAFVLPFELYAWDFATGLTALFVLSYLHVYLELPLNARTFAGIGGELSALRRRG